MSERRLCALALAAAGAALAAMFWPLAFGRLFLYADLGGSFLPLRLFLAERIARGESALWMPHLFCGFHVHGEGQIGLLHPLRRLAYTALPPDLAFGLEGLLPYPVALVGFAWWLRRLGLPASAAVFGGICFGLGPFLTLRLTHLDTIAVLAHVPWLLVAIDVLLRESGAARRRLAWLAVALLTGSQLLTGYPPAIPLSLAIEGAFAVSLLLRGAALPAVIALAAAKGVGLLLGAPQWLPTWEEIDASLRATASVEFRAAQSLHPLNLLLPLAPWLFRDRVYQVEMFNPIEQAFYLGAVVPVAALWLSARGRRLAVWHRNTALWLAAACALATALALGRYLPGYSLLSELPLLGLLRVPSRFTLGVSWVGALLAAWAFADLRSAPAASPGADRAPLRAIWLAPALSLAIALAALALRQDPADVGFGGRGAIRPPLALLWSPVLLALAALLVHAAARGVRLALPALVAFTLADLASYGATLWWSETPLTLAEYKASVPRAPSTAPERLVTDHVQLIERTPDGVGHYREVTRRIVHDTRLVSGYIGLMPARRLDYSFRGPLRLAGATYAEIRGGYRPLEPPFPRARLVAHSVVSAEPAKTLAQIDPAQTAIVDTPLELGDGDAPGTAAVVEDLPGRIRVQVAAPARRLLVLTESYHAGWQARCEGAPCATARVYGDFLGAVVEPGVREVELRFAPASLARGVRLAGVGAALLVGLPLASLATARRRRGAME